MNRAILPTTKIQSKMKKAMLAIALILGVVSANAQESTGDLFEGLTKKVTYDRMIPP